MAQLHDVDCIVDGDVDTTHHALIITEEEDRQAPYAIYCNEERFLLVAMHHVEPRYLVHI